MRKNQALIQNLVKFGYLITVTGLLYLALSHRVYDDPFITYRYAKNIRDGLGFVYNPNEQILSTTTPLFALLLAIGGYFWSNTPHLASLIGAFSIAVGGLCLWELGRVWKSPWVGWSGLLLYPTFPLLLSTLGSETPPFLALVLGVFLLYARKYYGPAILALALSILIRSDGVLVAVILGIHYFWINRYQLRQPKFWRAQPWGWIVTAAGVLLLWHGFAWQYYGAPLPVTLASKQAQGRMAISRLFAPSVLRVAGWYAGDWQYWAELGLIVIGLIFAFWQKQRWLLVLGWTGLYFLAYTLLRVTGYFWYYAPLVPGWVVAVGLGITFWAWLPLPGQWRTSPKAHTFRNRVVVLLVVALFLAQFLNVNQMRQTIDKRYPIYRAVGEWLAANTAEEASVGALEVGIIGYFADRPIIDFAGLIQPEVAGQMQSETTYDDTAVWATLKYQPEYLALIAGAHPRLETEVVAAHCQLIKRFEGSQYGYSNMHIFYCEYD